MPSENVLVEGEGVEPCFHLRVMSPRATTGPALGWCLQRASNPLPTG